MFSIRTLFGSMRIVCADIVICYLVFHLAVSFLPGLPSWLLNSGFYAKITCLAFTLIIIISLAFCRLYFFMEYIYPIDLVQRIIPAFFLSFVSVATVGFFISELAVLNWRLPPLLAAIYSALFVFRFFLFFCMPENRQQILILGATGQTREIIREAKSRRFRGYEIMGVLTTLESQLNTQIEGVPVIDLIFNIEDIVKKYSVDSIVVTLRDRRGKLPVHELLRCKMRNILIQEGYHFYENVKRKILIDDFFKPSWFIFEKGFFHTSLHGAVKRTQGIIVSLIILTVLSPVLLLVAILIKIESPGPVFFIQERVGQRGRIFRLLKFRSMRSDAESITGPTFAQKNDPRITKVGAVIRKIRIDEVPQLINIFKGDMDLVGPRPERPVFVEKLEKMVPYYNMRHAVRPGLTGWAQVNYSYGENFEDSREKLKYDLYYVKHFSWYLDLMIVFLTVREVIFGKGR